MGLTNDYNKVKYTSTLVLSAPLKSGKALTEFSMLAKSVHHA